MRRHLDLTALRSFVAVADTGGITRAAGLLNLTQSAVSMQIKRLEELLEAHLLDRTQRQIRITAEGEQLLSYARRMIALNDEAFARMMEPVQDGTITLGVPHDIVHPIIPGILKRFNAVYPGIRLNLISSATRELKGMLERGEAHVILTTEEGLDRGGETLSEWPLVWVGAPDGRAWTRRPLRIAFCSQCIFKQSVQNTLDAAGIPWEMVVEAEAESAIEASVIADLAVTAMLDRAGMVRYAAITHNGALPDLSTRKINLYTAPDTGTRLAAPLMELLNLVREGYRAESRGYDDMARRPAVA